MVAKLGLPMAVRRAEKKADQKAARWDSLLVASTAEQRDNRTAGSWGSKLAVQKVVKRVARSDLSMAVRWAPSTAVHWADHLVDRLAVRWVAWKVTKTVVPSAASKVARLGATTVAKMERLMAAATAVQKADQLGSNLVDATAGS